MPAAEPENAGDEDMENLMSALGQESEKVDKLVELLQEQGVDPTHILNEVERLTTSLSALWSHLHLHMRTKSGKVVVLAELLLVRSVLKKPCLSRLWVPVY